jgi:hypothetical protein
MTSRSGTFWSDACYHARSRPLQALMGAAYASCGVTVKCAPPAAPPEHMPFAVRAQLYRPVCDALLCRLPRTFVVPLWADQIISLFSRL